MTEPLITDALDKEVLIKDAGAVAPDQYFDHVLPKMVGDRRIRIDISRNTLIAIFISIILHAIILFVVLPKPKNEPPAGLPPPIEVSLVPPPVVVPPEVIPEEVVQPDVPKVITQKPKPNRKPEFTVPDAPDLPKPPEPQVEPVKPKVESPPLDMAEMIRRNQAKKYGEEYAAARQNAEAAASENGMTDSQKRDERIAKNLKGGAGGIFSSPNIRGRYATFNFNGWVNSLGNQRQQYFEVEAQPGQDVRLLVIQRMISFIRESYPGDFPWDSQRLGKVVTLSARPQDSAELENFLMVEFYGKDYRTNF